MGNLCGKESSPSTDHFSQPGRTLSSAPPAASTSTLPKKVVVVGGPARTMGANTTKIADSSTINTTRTTNLKDTEQSSSVQEDVRRRAAEAAQARANATNKPKGRLASQLLEQKKQTRSDTLDGLSKDERRVRDSDAAADTRAYN